MTPANFVERLWEGISDVAAKPLWEAFANTGGNPNSSVIKSFMKNFGIANPTTSIEAALSKPGCWASLKNDLDVFIRVRNECAHTGTVTASPQLSTIIGYCDFLDELALGIDSALIGYLGTI